MAGTRYVRYILLSVVVSLMARTQVLYSMHLLTIRSVWLLSSLFPRHLQEPRAGPSLRNL